MSFVIGYVSEKEVIIAGDGRAVDNGGNVISENITKVHKLNENIVVGFAGDFRLCDRTLSILKQSVGSKVFGVMFADQAAKRAGSVLKDYGVDGRMCSFMVWGIAENGDMIMADMYGSSNYEITWHKAGHRSIDIIPFFPHGEEGGTTILDRCYESLQIGDSPEKFLEMAIAEFAKEDTAVNGNVTLCKVLKQVF